MVQPLKSGVARLNIAHSPMNPLPPPVPGVAPNMDSIQLPLPFVICRTTSAKSSSLADVTVKVEPELAGVSAKVSKSCTLVVGDISRVKNAAFQMPAVPPFETMGIEAATIGSADAEVGQLHSNAPSATVSTYEDLKGDFARM